MDLCITKQHVELDNTTSLPNMDSQLNISENEDIYNEIEILYPLEIRNYQNDNNSLKYTYKLKIEGVAGTYKYKYKDKEDYMVFTANGEAEIILESNESIIIYDMPDNSSYEIEQLNTASDKYVTKVDDRINNKVSGNVTSNSLVEFDNQTIKAIEAPGEEQENPYTKDKHYLIVLMATLAFMLIITAKALSIKRFV